MMGLIGGFETSSIDEWVLSESTQPVPFIVKNDHPNSRLRVLTVVWGGIETNRTLLGSASEQSGLM